MKKLKGKISSDYKNSTSSKTYDFESFIAKYNNGNYYRIFIDRSDERRVMILLNQDEFEDFKKAINDL